jgi:hypothetical protein
MLVLAVALSWGWPRPASPELVDPAPYDALLRVFVHAGKVHYAALAAHRADLDRFLDALAEVDPESGTDEEQTALWINVYNAGTLSLLLDHSPIRRSSFLGYLYPENSIRHIADAWDRVQVRVGGTEFTLNEIAHEILRKRFQEPRVLFALASGARSSPVLRGEAYVAAHLDEQLESAARAYLDDPEHGFRIEPERHTVWVSRLFLWFGRDFVPAHAEGPLAESGKFSETEAAVLHFIRARRPPAEQALLDGGDFALRYLRHDWRLNGQ